MPKRKTDPITGQPQLTYREHRLVNEFLHNGGNGAQAAAAAGYKAARLDQAAYQALHRECVQRHIRERIRESCVSSDEIVGTLVSHMRGNLTEFFDESGNFSIEVARQKGLGHLIKSISGTICDPPNQDDQDDLDDQNESQDALNTALNTEDSQDSKRRSGRPRMRSNPPTRKRRRSPRPPSFRIQLHSPLQAASILARLIGIDRHHPYRPLNQPSTCNLQPATNPDFDPNSLLQSLIEEQMKEHGLSREAVTNRILQVRPEFAKYLDELPGPPSLLDQLSLRDTGKLLGVILDAFASLKSSLSNPTSDDRVLHACQQVEAMLPLLDPQESPSPSPQTGAPVLITYAQLAAAVDRVLARLSGQEQDSLVRLQLQSLIRQGIIIPDSSTADRDSVHSHPEPAPPSHNLQPEPDPAEPDPAEPEPATCNLQPSTSPQPATSPQPETSSLDEFNRKYSNISRPFLIGQPSSLVDIIHDIMKNESLTPQQAVDSIWLVARQSTWSFADRIDRCIADFARLHPRLAQAQPPVCARRPQSPPRYYRPGTSQVSAQPKPRSAHEVDDSDDPDCAGDSEILTSTQLFRPRPPTIRSG